MREVTIKGVRQGILLVLPDEQDFEALRAQLNDKLSAASGLIAGAKAQLDLGERPLGEAELKVLLGQLAPYRLEATAVIATADATKAAAEACGLSVTAPPNAPAAQPERTRPSAAPTADPGVLTNNALYLRQTIRSGQSIRHDGTIVICGDVNPGAEIVATGDIIVFGTLRGVAHAGAAGDEDCHITAINLRPTQIRIAGYIARSPDAAAPPLSKYPEVARVQDSEIHIIPLRDMN